MKPGDLIEWSYKHNKKLVYSDEEIWSTIMKCWVPIGIVSTLLHCDKKTYSWFNSKGCFRVRVDDVSMCWSTTRRWQVFPRACR
jgi:hypothetical protein